MKKNSTFDLIKCTYRMYGSKILCLLIFGLLLMSCVAQKNTQIDVTKLGVVINDNKDDSKAMQEIINKATPGSTIFLPAGEYTWDSPVYIKTKNITLKGEKDTKLVFSNIQDYYKLYATKVGMLNIGASDITIDNIYFDQNFRNSGRNCGDMPLIGGIFSGCTYLGGAIFTNNTLIKNCTVYDYYGDGISVFNAPTNNFTAINDHLVSAFIVGNWNECPHKGEQGINVVIGSNILITNNIIEGAIDDAIATHVNCSNVTITGNTITTIRGRILVNGVTNGIIKNNTIEYLRDGWTAIMISLEPDSKLISKNHNILVEGNKIHINKGALVLSAIMLYGPGTNITIKKNTITSDEFQDHAGIQLAEIVYYPTKTFYFGDSIRIAQNQISNFYSGVKFNISSKVKVPLVVFSKNKFINATKEINKETGPFLIRPPRK